MTFSFVQGPASATGSSATPALAFAGSTPAGNLVYAVLTQTYGANPPRTITNCRDSIDGAVDYTLLEEGHDAASNLFVHIYGRVATSAGTRTVTFTMSGVCDYAIAVNEWSSTNGFVFGSVSGTDKSNATGTGTAMQAGSITPAGNALYVMAAVWSNGTGTTVDATGGWNARQERESGSSSLVAIQDLVASGAQNPAMTLGSSQIWAAAITAIGENAAGIPAPVFLNHLRTQGIA